MSSGPPSKFALETFLTGVTSKTAKFGDMAKASSDSAAPSPDSDLAESRRSVVLTVLNQFDRALEEKVLLDYSELPSETFQQAMGQLKDEGLVVASEDGYKLTEAGHEEAEKRRSRLLRMR
jgi:predicted methyltransferase